MMSDEWLGQRLHQYAIYDRDDSLEDILQGDERQNINAPDRWGRTPVYTAVSNNSIKCLEILLKHGADPSIAGGACTAKMTPLHHAIFEGKREAIKLLLLYGADLNQLDESGLSPVSLVRSIGVREYIQIFDEEAERRHMNALQVVSDLCQACEVGNHQKVRDMLRLPAPAGLELANMSVPDDESRTPLSVAARKGDFQIMSELLATVAIPRSSPYLMHIATEAGHLNIVKLLLQDFPDFCNAEDENNQTPLHIACAQGNLDIVKCLMDWSYPESQYTVRNNEDETIQYRLAININSYSIDGKTPLYIACENGHESVVKYLLKFEVSGTQPDRSSVGDRSSQSSLPSSEGEPVQPSATDVKFKPVQVDMPGDQSRTSILADGEDSLVLYRPVHTRRPPKHTHSCVYIAVKNGYHSIVDSLVDAGANMDLIAKRNNVDCSLLLLQAIENEDILMVGKLLKYNVTDVNEQALQEAVRSLPQYIPQFLKHKASVDKKNNINRSLMRKEYSDASVSAEKVHDLPASHPTYVKMFPTQAVSVRWQRLNVLTTVEEKWLTCVANEYNSNMTNVNTRIPLFAITKVDVSFNRLNIMPTALLQLPSVCSLDVSNNQISEFPKLSSFHLDCQCLEKLFVQENKLQTIPDYIFMLPNLRHIIAINNVIAVLPPEIWQAKKLEEVDLSKNKLDTLPYPVWLEKNVRSDSSSDADNATPEDAVSLDQLELVDNSHVTIMELRRVNHWSNRLTISDEDVKTSEGHHKGMKTLTLDENQLNVFPEFLSCCCPHLENLNLSKNKLKALGNLAGYPKLLKKLDLKNNQIESMEDWQVEEEGSHCFCAVDKKSMLSASGAFSAKMPGPICGHRNHLKLENLELLDLSFNKLTSLTVLRSTSSALGLSMSQSHRNLEQIEQDGQHIKGKLLFPNLTTLHIDANQISQLPEEIGEQECLREFTLKRNSTMRELPPTMGFLDNLQRIEVDMCPLEGPIQDILKGATSRASDITGFLRSVLEEPVQYNCMNLMLVGAHCIGKTTVLEQLAKKGASKPRTHFTQRQNAGEGANTTRDGQPLSTVGIDINQLIFTGKHGEVHLKTWDFAGQSEYYATHQYFLSRRSLYLVVWNLQEEEKGIEGMLQWLINIQKEYYATHQYFLSLRSLYLVVWNLKDGEPGVEGLRLWLVNIQAQAPGAPVIIVGTHLDEIQSNKKSIYPPDWEVNMRRMVNDRYINKIDSSAEGLPRVLDTINVGCGRKVTNIGDLKNCIYERVFNLTHPARKNEKLLGHKVPKKYMKLQTCIENIVKDREQKGKEPVLDTNAYMLTVMNEMSKENCDTTFRNKEDLYQATRFLHENGVLCHFADTSLKDQYFLKPQWLCDQLAKVVSIKEVQKYSKEGVMAVRDLYQVYKNSDRIGQYILSLLSKFEVALQFDNDNLLLPSLLPTDDHLDSSRMKEIPVRRKGLDFPPMSVSIETIGLTQMYQPLPSVSAGEMFIVHSSGDRNPTFSNTRLYLLTYFPSGFWPRLITRILADESFYNPVRDMYPFSQELSEKCPDIRNAVPSWRCWQTGLELVYFGNVIMQVKQVRSGSMYAQGMCNYSTEGLTMQCYLENQWSEIDIQDSSILEISFQADKITFNFGFHVSMEHQNLQSMESKQIFHDEKAKTSILSKVVEHVDSLLQDWFPEIGESRFLQSCTGRYLITRLVLCPLCLQAEYQHQMTASASWEVLSKTSEQSHSLNIGSDAGGGSDDDGTDGDEDDANEKRVIYTFLVENCVKNVLDGIDEMCKKHLAVSPKCMPTEDGVNRVLHIAPDLIFQDLDESFLVEDDLLQVGKKLGKGAFGTVSAGKLIRAENTIVEVAVKELYDHKKRDKRQTATQISLETVCAAYTTARQEVSILQTVEHPHIVPLLGLSRRPLALLLSLAPQGSLYGVLEARHKDGLRLQVWVIKQIVIQTVDALDYLHNRSIIYRDLKSDNVLVWTLPGPTDQDSRKPVVIKLADYGISRSVVPAGAKGYGGTPPYIAPEILVHCGKDTYTEKVDIFSFGIFMFELLTCRPPLVEINNPLVHVVHGGRPSLNSEEADCPSHMLDLMTLSWAQDPDVRPSAAQVRMVASSPQFCHLCDAVALETQSNVLSACSLFVESTGGGTTVDQTQVWIASQSGCNYNLEILNYNLTHKCVEYKELRDDLEVLAVCTMDNHIWCLDKQGVIHMYSPHSLDKVSDYTLPVSRISGVYGMTYHPGCGQVTILLKEQLNGRETTLFSFTRQQLQSCDILPTLRIPAQCFCATIVKSTELVDTIWLGSKGGVIHQCLVERVQTGDQAAVKDGDQPGVKAGTTTLVMAEKTLHPYSNSLLSPQQNCLFIVSSVNTCLTQSAWSYSYPGSKVFHWDTVKEEVVATLDCSSIIPASDSYRVQQTRRFEANHYQVTTMSAVGKYLYVGTTWGCVIIADAKTLKPYSAFRCHGDEDFYCKSILSLGAAKSCSCHHEKTSTTECEQGSCSSAGIVTIGKGYNNIIKHVTSLDPPALVQPDVDSSWSLASPPRDTEPDRDVRNTYALSWAAAHWERY